MSAVIEELKKHDYYVADIGQAAYGRKEIAIVNVRRQNGCTQAAIDLLASGRIDADFMVTHRFSLERATEAFELVAEYRDGVVKAMIEM